MSKSSKYKSTAKGFMGGEVIEPNQEFLAEPGLKGSWFDGVEPEPEPEKPKKEKRPKKEKEKDSTVDGVLK